MTIMSLFACILVLSFFRMPPPHDALDGVKPALVETFLWIK